MKKLLIKSIIRVFVIVIIVTLASFVQSPVLNNQIAMGQLSNSNEYFLLLEAYNKLKVILDVIVYAISIYLGASISVDIYKYFKTNDKKETN